jgi:hypothetical protein
MQAPERMPQPTTPRLPFRWPRRFRTAGIQEDGMPVAGGVRPSGDDEALREYLRDLQADLRYWYTSAEAKAQVVLTANGAFVTFLTAAALGTRASVVRATAVFGPETWSFLALMSLCLALAILSAVTCVASRGVSRRALQESLGRYAVDPDRAGTYPPELAAFFGHLSGLKAGPLTERLRTAGPDFTIAALASDIIALAPNIVAKHRWVNRAFVLTGMTLGFFLCTGISYLIRVHLAAGIPGH